MATLDEFEVLVQQTYTELNATEDECQAIKDMGAEVAGLDSPTVTGMRDRLPDAPPGSDTGRKIERVATTLTELAATL